MAATFVLALIGVVLSSVSLAWQVLNYVLTGARVKVSLLLGVGDEDGPQALWSLGDDNTEFIMSGKVEKNRTELAIVDVYNAGRSAITVTAIGLGASDNRRKFKSGATVVTPQGQNRVRLEPGDSHRWHNPVWDHIETLRQERGTAALRVRGVANVGERLPIFSSRRDTWTVAADQYSAIPPEPDGSRT